MTGSRAPAELQAAQTHDLLGAETHTAGFQGSSPTDQGLGPPVNGGPNEEAEQSIKNT